MSEGLTIEDSVKLLLNREGSEIREDEIQKLLQNYENSSDLGQLLDVVERLDEENEENINRVISMASSIDESFKEPLNRIKETAADFDEKVNRFQYIQDQFNNSFKQISSNLMPLVITNQNLDLAIGLYTKLKNGLVEMDKFIKLFCLSGYNDKTNIEKAVNDHLDRILATLDYFYDTPNNDINEIFSFRLDQWESEISSFFQREVDLKTGLGNYAIFFGKFDQNHYKHADEVKKSILLKIFSNEFSYLDKYKIKGKNKFNGEYGISNYSRFVSDIIKVLETISSIKVQENIIGYLTKVALDIFSEFIDSVDSALKNNGRLHFSYFDFYNEIETQASKRPIDSKRANKDKFDSLLSSIKGKAADEKIQSWRSTLRQKVKDDFLHYRNNPNDIYNRIKDNLGNPKGNKRENIQIDNGPSTKIYPKYERQLIIKEVFNIIFTFETTYDIELMRLQESSNPDFTDLLIDVSNQIIENLNNINFSNADKRRTTIIIIINSYYALCSLVNQYKSIKHESSKRLLSLTYFDASKDGFLFYFASHKSFSTEKIQKFFEYTQNIVDDSLKMEFATKFAQHEVALIILQAAASKHGSINIRTYNHFLKEVFNSASNMQKKIMESKEQVCTIYEDNFLPVLKKLWESTITFLKNPNNSTMNDLINLFEGHVIPEFEDNLTKIIEITKQ